jgi:hypothetical protein
MNNSNHFDPLFFSRVRLPFEFSLELANRPGRKLLPGAPAIKAVRAEYLRYDAWTADRYSAATRMVLKSRIIVPRAVDSRTNRARIMFR